jgi:hypothetical protein
MKKKSAAFLEAELTKAQIIAEIADIRERIQVLRESAKKAFERSTKSNAIATLQSRNGTGPRGMTKAQARRYIKTVCRFTDEALTKIETGDYRKEVKPGNGK